MGWVIDQCLILLHPIMPFITEELWGTIAKREKMLVHADWPTYGPELINAEADREMHWVIGLIESIRSARAQMRVPAGLQIPLIVTEMDDMARAAWSQNETMIMKLARLVSLDHVDIFPKGTITLPAAGATFGLPLADIIDVDAEKTRIEKSLQKLAKEIGGMQGRLNNPKFVASAPAEVIEETRANLVEKLDEQSQFQAALDRLNELG